MVNNKKQHSYLVFSVQIKTEIYLYICKYTNIYMSIYIFIYERPRGEIWLYIWDITYKICSLQLGLP